DDVHSVPPGARLDNVFYQQRQSGLAQHPLSHGLRWRCAPYLGFSPVTRTPQDTLAVPSAERPILGSMPRISAIACSSPARSYSQREVLALLDLEGDEFAERIFERSGVSRRQDRKSTRLNSSHVAISYAV